MGYPLKPGQVGWVEQSETQWQGFLTGFHFIQPSLDLFCHLSRFKWVAGLCVHDWSRLSYKHANKPDTYAITHDTDIGYDLQTSLIISDQTGQPLAPVAQRLVSSDGSFATYQEINPQPVVQNHLDEICDCIRFLDRQGFAQPLLHLIDREGDSISHIRLWESTGSHWLIRVKDNPKVDYEDKPMACKAVAQEKKCANTRTISQSERQIKTMAKCHLKSGARLLISKAPF